MATEGATREAWPFTKRVLEAVAAAMDWYHGAENVLLAFQDGELRH